MNETRLKLFENQNIRTQWDEKTEKWYFSVIDIVAALTGTDRPRKYWNDLKTKLIQEGSELSEKIGQLKLKSSDGKFYKTDVADTEQILRLIQSIPSKKAEPFKLWLASVGRERIDEISDPEIAIGRALDYYQRKGYSNEWIALCVNRNASNFVLLVLTYCLSNQLVLPPTQTTNKKNHHAVVILLVGDIKQFHSYRKRCIP